MGKIDTSGIKSTMITIFTVLRKQQEKVSEYRKECARITSSEEYNSDFKAKKIAGLTANLRDFALENLKNLELFLNSMLRDGKANEEVFNIDDPKLQATIQLINTAGKGIDYRTRDNIVHSFIGDQQALIMIKTLFQAKEIDTEEVSKYIFSIEEKVEKMKDIIYPMTYEAGKSMYNIVDFSKKLLNLAKLSGFELTDQESSIGLDENSYAIQQARAAMGLPPVE